MWRKALVLILATFSAGGMLIQPAQGKEYPTSPVEIYVPYPPGSPMDIMSRLFVDKAPKYLGQPVVIVNKAGAGGSIAAADILSSKPDGYKIINLTTGFFTQTTKTQKIPFDPGQLTPLAIISQLKGGICVRGDSPFKTFNDLLDYAKKNPGKLTWAHSGRGTFEYIASLLTFRKVGAETIDVATKGTPEKIVAILGGHVDSSYMSWGAVADHVKAGKVRFLIVMSDRRYSDAPGIPCSTELGFPEVAKISMYNGYFIHKDTPDEIKKILFEFLKKAYEDPEVKKGLEKVGDELRFEGPEFIKEVITKGAEITAPILKELGLYVEK
jgi:tripartite-type tricarboxylate transporter receptor subunit TctC